MGAIGFQGVFKRRRSFFKIGGAGALGSSRRLGQVLPRQKGLNNPYLEQGVLRFSLIIEAFGGITCDRFLDI